MYCFMSFVFKFFITFAKQIEEKCNSLKAYVQ